MFDNDITAWFALVFAFATGTVIGNLVTNLIT